MVDPHHIFPPVLNSYPSTAFYFSTARSKEGGALWLARERVHEKGTGVRVSDHPTSMLARPSPLLPQPDAPRASIARRQSPVDVAVVPRHPARGVRGHGWLDASEWWFLFFDTCSEKASGFSHFHLKSECERCEQFLSYTLKLPTR